MFSTLQNLEVFASDKIKNLQINNSKIISLRKEQVEILQKCNLALAQNPQKHILIKAPTGCGKTLAYSLVASYIIQQKGRVLIVCPTKDLQRQVSETCDALNLDSIEIYGSGEYICPARSRLLGVDAKVITQFCAHRKTCYYKEKHMCNYSKAHELAKKYPLVIANYNIYLERWDYFTGGEKFDLIIFDEAHNLEKIAEDSSRVHISTTKIKNWEKNFLIFWNKNYETIKKNIPILQETFLLEVNDINKEDIIKAIGLFKALDKQFQESKFGDNVEVQPSELNKYGNICRNLVNVLENFSLLETCNIVYPEDSPSLKSREALTNFTIASTQQRKYYTFKGHSDYGYSEIYGELNVLKMVRYILSKSAKVQCHVSATLGNTFDYAARIGLLQYQRTGEINEETKDNLPYIECEITKYPFDLKRRILLGLIDGPRMNKREKVNDRDYDWESKQKIANELLEKLLLSWPGNTLIFFRSRNEAEKTYNYLSRNAHLSSRLYFKKFFETGKERKELIEQFKKNKGSILLGFGRMDQGLDLPGEYLTLIILYALPFVYRSDQMQKDFDYFKYRYGTSRAAFEKVDLDVAAKRVSQLVGRLIRSDDDFGAVVVLDRRFYTKFYRWMMGRNMIPQHMNFEFVNTDSACYVLEQFWEKMVGMEYFEYISRDVSIKTLKDFGLSVNIE